MADKAEKIIQIDRIEDAVSIFGELDENVNLIEKEYNVKIYNRGDDIKITGNEENVFYAGETVKGLISLLDKGEQITEQSIRYVFSLVKEDKQNELSSLAGNGICVTARGKTVKAKTLGQKRYVEAIARDAIVLGVGPART